jgi:hypothetical protein
MRLDRSYLTAGQKEQVRETAYVTLVSLADWGVRWDSLLRRQAYSDPLGRQARPARGIRSQHAVAPAVN